MCGLAAAHTLVAVTEAMRQRILNPEPGSALARARDYGIDLTLILKATMMTPEERIENVVRLQRLARLTEEIRGTLRRA